MRAKLIQRLTSQACNELCVEKDTVVRKGDLLIFAVRWRGSLKINDIALKESYTAWLWKQSEKFFQQNAVEHILTTTHLIIIRLKKKVRRKTK